jgi:hypothetical protein
MVFEKHYDDGKPIESFQILWILNSKFFLPSSELFFVRVIILMETGGSM